MTFKLSTTTTKYIKKKSTTTSSITAAYYYFQITAYYFYSSIHFKTVIIPQILRFVLHTYYFYLGRLQIPSTSENLRRRATYEEGRFVGYASYIYVVSRDLTKKKKNFVPCL